MRAGIIYRDALLAYYALGFPLPLHKPQFIRLANFARLKMSEIQNYRGFHKGILPLLI